MSEAQKKTGSSGAAGAITFAILACLVAIPVLYVLSSGPLTWLYEHGYVGDWVYPFCAPFRLARNTFPLFQSFVDWYTGLFGD
jgi:hypothetical protein